MLAHRLLVESVDLRRLGGSAGGNDVLSDRFDRCPEAPGEKKLGPFAPKRACDGATDRASGSVDHCDLILEQHHCFSCFGAQWHPFLGRRSSDAKRCGSRGTPVRAFMKTSVERTPPLPPDRL